MLATPRPHAGPALVLALALSAAMAGAGQLVLTHEDFPIEVGTRTALDIRAADGEARGRVEFAIVAKMQVGQATLFRQAQRLGAMELEDAWLVRDREHLALFNAFGAPRPMWELRLPIKKGDRYVYESPTAKVQVHAEGQEEIETPAGKFTCLVLAQEQEHGGERLRHKNWVAPKRGLVKLTTRLDKDDVTMTLVAAHEPVPPPRVKGADVLSHFDSGRPLSSPLFPKALWHAKAGKAGQVSTATLDPWTGADGSPFSLRWSYHARDTWLNCTMVPSGTWGAPADLSRYGGISFHVKAQAAGQCAFVMQAKVKGEEGRIFASVPIAVTTTWQKLTLGPQKNPELAGLDFSKVYLIGFGNMAAGEAANTIWFDQILLHRGPMKHEF